MVDYDVEMGGSQSPWDEEAAQGRSSMPKTEPFDSSDLHEVVAVVQNGNGAHRGTRSNGAGQQGRFTSELPSRPSTSHSSGASALDVLGRDVKELMDAIQKLRILGFETSVVSLPKIVVIGDQSTGKSSVIEGISGIRVPRSVGTCTRCPLEINLSHSDEPWCCKVFLSRRFMYTPKSNSINSKRPFGPWDALDTPDETSFTTLSNKDDVADALAWAQLATLNPGANPLLYIPGQNKGTRHTKQVEFSPNVVRLDISGPELTNLAFYDLPGLISHVSDESDQYLVKLVDNLAKEYMKSEETLILLTLTMNHDVQNSKAAGMIQKFRAEERTLGVFTKPDLMSPEAEKMFVDVLSGKNFKRQLGYFAVKNNPKPEIDHGTARAEEKEFFTKWCKDFPQLSRYRDRFGTDVLTRELSKLLAIRIRCSMPKIRKIIHEKIAEHETELEKLPRPPTGNLSLDISSNITALGRDLELLFETNTSTSSKRSAFNFFEDWQAKTRHFRNLLVQSYPRLSLSVNSSSSLAATSRNPRMLQSRHTAEVIPLDDDDEMENPSLTPQPRTPAGRKRELGADKEVSPAKRVRLGDIPVHGAAELAKIYTLDEVRDLISNKDDTGLPGAQNPIVTKDIYGQSISHWRKALTDYLGASHQLCGSNIMECIRRAFAKQANTPLMTEVQTKAKTFVKSQFAEHQRFAGRHMKMETTIMTLGSSAIETARAAALEEMKSDRNRDRTVQNIEQDESLNENLRQKKIEAALKGKNTDLGPDEFEREIIQMAIVRGYYGYAANRLAESVALNFRSETFEVLRDKLCPHLTEELHLNEEDANVHIRKLLEVNADVANERARREQELVRLRDGLTEITKLENSGSASDVSWDMVSTQSQSTIL